MFSTSRFATLKRQATATHEFRFDCDGLNHS